MTLCRTVIQLLGNFFFYEILENRNIEAHNKDPPIIRCFPLQNRS